MSAVARRFLAIPASSAASDTGSRIIGKHAVRQTTQNDNNYLSFDRCCLKGPEETASRRPVGDRATPRHITHATDITTRASMVASDAALFLAAAAERESFMGGRQCCAVLKFVFPKILTLVLTPKFEFTFRFVLLYQSVRSLGLYITMAGLVTLISV